MTNNQRDKVLNLICLELIPAIKKVQHSDFYPYSFTYNDDESFYLYINKDSITEGAENVDSLSKMSTRGRSEICLGDSPSIIKSLAMSMIAFLKEAEKHQKEINDIIQFSENIVSTNSRVVLIEKYDFIII